MRVGLLAKKIGMTRIFDETGTHQAVTVVECPESVVMNAGHNAKNRVKLASFNIKEKSINKPQIAEFKKLKTHSKKHTIEFQVDDAADYKAGSVITVDHFVEGQYVDVRGRNIGKGFAGGMKRHGFGGLEATHGISVSHRSHGSTGQCQDPGKVFKGKKMAGQMGNVNVTIQNLEIIKIDSEKSLIFIKGAIPGKPGGVVRLTDAVKRNLPLNAPLPAFFKKEEEKKSEVKTAETKREEKNVENKKSASDQNITQEKKVTVENQSQKKASDKAKEDK